MSLVVKVHHRENRTIVSVVDTVLLGKRFEEQNKVLDLQSDFYQGQERDEAETGDLIRNADSINLVGEGAIALGLHEGVIEPSHVGKIKGIPYAQAVLIHD